MAYVKKYATAAERSAAFSRAAKSRKHNNGGRPKGAPNKNPVPRVPSRTLTVRQPDYEVFVKCASIHKEDDKAIKNGVPIVEFMHLLAESLKKKNPNIFAPDAQKVEM